MSESPSDATVRILREIQSELADMRDDRTVMIAILNRHDSAINSLCTEMRALRSQVDRFRNEMRDRLTRIEETLELRSGVNERLSRIEAALQHFEPER